MDIIEGVINVPQFLSIPMILYCTRFNMLCSHVFPRTILVRERYTWNARAAYWWMWYWTFAQRWWWRCKNSEISLIVAGWVSEISKDHFSFIFGIKQCKYILDCLAMKLKAFPFDA